MKNYLKIAKLGLMVMACALFLGIGIKAEAAPGKVLNVKQTGATSGGVGIKWDVPEGTIAKYIVELADNKKFTGATYVTDDILPDTTTGSLPTQYAFLDLKAGKTYYARVSAIDVSGEQGEVSNPIDVVTAPSGKITGLKQTKAAANKITLTWKKNAGATGYDVGYRKAGTNAKWKSQIVKGNTCTLTVAKNTKYVVEVIPFRQNSAKQKAYEANEPDQKYMSTLPQKVTKVKFLYGGEGDNSQAKVAYFSWNASHAADGYDYEVYGNNGKKLFNGSTTTVKSRIANGKMKNSEFMKIRVRAFVKVGGKKKYGPYSDYTWFAKYPAGVTKQMVGRYASDGVKISWKKVTGATDYTLYVSTSQNGGYKKVTTTKGTSAVIKKCNGSALTTYKPYYYYVVANKKVGGKTYHGDDSWFGQIYITTQYY